MHKELTSFRAKYEEEMLTWGEVTDNDRLDAAFAQFNKEGILSSQNCGKTLSDGHYQLTQAAKKAYKRRKIVYEGICFYHEQDLNNAVFCGQLALRWAMSEETPSESTATAFVMKLLRILKDNGVSASWNNNLNASLHVTLKWRQRPNK